MLLKLIPSLKENKVIIWINKILCSPFYIAFVAIMLTLSAIFNVGFVFYYIIAATSIVLPALLGEDMTGLIPLAVMLNIGISKEVAAMNDKVVLGVNLPHFIVMVSIVTIFMFGRLIFDLIVNKERRQRFPRFLIGFCALMFAFTLGGRLFDGHTIEDYAFGIREFLALSGFYFYFFYTIDFTKMKKSYFAWLLFFFALSVSTQILVEACRSGLEKPLLVGWANRSGLGGTLVASFTGVTYLIIKNKARFAWIFVVFAFFFLTMLGMAQCRGAAYTGILMGIACFVLIMVFTNKFTRITTGVLTGAYIIAFILLYNFDIDFIHKCFGRLVDFDFDTLNGYSSGRIEIWKTGLDQFIHHPVFGVGWYQIPNLGFQARYHNTLVQLLASTGIFGTLCYAFHRFETYYVTFKKPNLEKTFAFIAILSILISSLLDCFLFNIWLGFEYGFLLAYIEGRNLAEGNKV